MNHLSPNATFRQAIERYLVMMVVEDALAQGYDVSVDNGESRSPAYRTRNSVLNCLFATDEERLHFHKPGVKHSMWTYMVYGNCGHDVLSDWTANEPTERIVRRANEAANLIAEGRFVLDIKVLSRDKARAQ